MGRYRRGLPLPERFQFRLGPGFEGTGTMATATRLGGAAGVVLRHRSDGEVAAVRGPQAAHAALARRRGSRALSARPALGRGRDAVVRLSAYDAGASACGRGFAAATAGR